MSGTTFPTTFTTNERRNSRPVFLYTFVRGDSIWRYTDSPDDITSSGVVYRAAVIAHSPFERSDESAAGEVSVTMAEVTPFVSALDAIGWGGRPVTCLIRQQHTSGVGGVVSVSAVVRYQGVVQARTLVDGSCAYRVASMAAVFDRPLLRIIASPTCNNTIYDANCGVDPTSFVTTGCAITAISDRTLTVAEAALQTDGYYTAGPVLVEDGTVAGERLFVQDHTGSALTMLTALPSGLQVGDLVSLYAGCDGLEATCLAKFANLDYFRGFSRMPTLNPFVKVG